MTAVKKFHDDELWHLIKKARLRLLRLHYEARAGHLGGNMSSIDAIITLYHKIMREDDLFLLSKGHSACALYVALWSAGFLPEEKLVTFALDGTTLPGHPSGTAIPGLSFPTGSLGHGLSLSCGLALAHKYRNSDGRIYCLCSDGEWQEGSCWEALIFAVRQKLNNVTVIIDQNGLQAFGTTSEVASMADLESKIASFGANVTAINGHDPDELSTGLRLRSKDKPSFVFLRTITGRGTCFQNKVDSHYLPLTKEQYEDACAREARF
jgi:transketolase